MTIHVWKNYDVSFCVLSVVVDQKLRLENSLASERIINEQSRAEQQQKSQDEKEQHNKITMEANIRYASLQQHYNLMKSQLDDLTEECSNSKKKQLEEVNSLRLKVSELQGKIALHQKESTSDVEQLKVRTSLRRFAGFFMSHYAFSGSIESG